MRMLEHEGIWFWFDHKAGSHTLVITDDIGLASPAPGCASLPFRSSGQGNPNEDFVTGWNAAGAVTSAIEKATGRNKFSDSQRLSG